MTLERSALWGGKTLTWNKCGRKGKGEKEAGLPISVSKEQGPSACYPNFVPSSCHLLGPFLLCVCLWEILPPERLAALFIHTSRVKLGGPDPNIYRDGGPGHLLK